MKLIKVILIATLALSCAGLTSCAGNKARLCVIDQLDIFSMEKDKSYTAPKQGWFLSNETVKEIGAIIAES